MFLRFSDHCIRLFLMVANHRSSDAIFAMYRSSHMSEHVKLTLLSIPFHFRFLSKFEIQSSLFWPFLDVRSDSCWEVWDLWINSKFIIAPRHGIYLNNNSRRQVQMFLALKGRELRFFHNWKISAYSGDPRNIADPVVLDQRYSQLGLKKLLVGF